MIGASHTPTQLSMSLPENHLVVQEPASALSSVLPAVRARISPVVREGCLSAAIAAGVGMALVWLGPPGGDLAAHAYLRSLFLRHGFTLWDNFWYAGRYSFVSYSVIYYPLAAVFGIKLLAVATVAAAGFAFAVVLGRESGLSARLASRVFAVVWAGVLLAGTYLSRSERRLRFSLSGRSKRVRTRGSHCSRS